MTNAILISTVRTLLSVCTVSVQVLADTQQTTSDLL